MLDNVINELISEISINSLARLNINEVMIYLLSSDSEGLTQELIQKSLLINNQNIIDFKPNILKYDEGIIGKSANTLKIEIGNLVNMPNSNISEIAVPIVYNNTLLGVIYAQHNSKNFFDSNIINILSNISTIFAVKLDKIQSEIAKEKLNRELLEQVKINQIGQIDALFEVTIDAVIVVDESLKIINSNHIAENMFGWSSLDVVGKKLTEAFILKSNENKVDLLSFFANNIQNNKRKITNEIIEFKIINNQDKEIEVTMGISQTHYQNNLIYILYFRDITERKKAEENLKKSKENAEQASKSKTDFLANMSHEIRTPMNAIIGFSELLYNSITDEKQKSQVNTIRIAAKNLLTIINDILDLSKIEAGKMELQLEKTNLNKLVKEVEIILNPISIEKNIQLYSKTESIKNYLLQLDSLKIKQILFNLVGNALKFTSKGHIIVTVDIINNNNNKYLDLFISVEDTGMGIPKDEIDLIFEKFSQKIGQDVKSFGGTGLGLSISKKLVELMGGELKVTSKLDAGSTFSFYLPNVPILEISNQNESNDEFTKISTKFEKSKILIADDLITNRELLKDILANSPIKFYEADNGKMAIEIATKELPDLILMDLKMPVLNGFEATKILKENEHTKQIPIIAISASAYMVLEENNEKNIFDDYITKPIDFNYFFNVLKKYLKVENTEIAENDLEKHEEHLESNYTSETKINVNELNEILIFLETKYQPAILIAIENQMIDEMEKIGNDLILYGTKKSLNIIVDYGKKIINFANNFEVNKLIDVLNKFPELINSLKNN